MPSLRPFFVQARFEPTGLSFRDRSAFACEGRRCRARAGGVATQSHTMTFDSLGLPEPLVRAVADAGYAAPTAVQSAAIPPALAGTDLMVAAATGSGKTASFILPALNRVLAARADTGKRRDKGTVYGPRILVLTPTRELAMQIAKAAATYGRHVPGLRVATVVGGVPYPAQLKALRGPLDILIATPGRLLDHLQTGKAVLEQRRDARPRRGRPHARHGLHRRHHDDRRPRADGAPDGDVQRHLPRPRRPPRPEPAARSAAGRGRVAHRHPRQHRAAPALGRQLRAQERACSTTS